MKTVSERFWSKVDKAVGGGCWVWLAAKDKRGYGRLQRARGMSPYKAHRLSWELANGVIPEGMEVCHSCDNPSCVRPDHLFIGTHKQNMLDMKIKGRGCVQSKGRVGERNNSAKLTELDVRKIRILVREGVRPTSLGRAFGVHPSCIRLITIGRNWKHIKE